MDLFSDRARRALVAWPGLAFALAGCAHFDSGPEPGIATANPPRTFRSIGARSTRPATGPLPAPEPVPPPSPSPQTVANTRSTAPPPGAVDPRNRPIPPLPPTPPPVADTSKPEATAAAPRPSQTSAAAVVAQARQAVDQLAHYQVRLRRQERVGPKLHDPEEVVLSIRRHPIGVRIEWPEGPNKGREVLYQAGDGPDVMHVNMPGAIVPRITLPINSPLALRNSRHPINEAGLESIVGVLEQWLAESPDQVRLDGEEVPDGCERPAHKVVCRSAEGETRVVHLDSQTHLPVAIHVTDLNGELLEHYRFRDFRPDCPELASNDSFEPSKRWGAPRGLLSRRDRTAPRPEADEGPGPPPAP